MKIHVIALLLCMVPCVAPAAATQRTEDSRIGINRVSMAGVRSMPNMTVDLPKEKSQSTSTTVSNNSGGNSGSSGGNGGNGSSGNGGNSNNDDGGADDGDCRDAYRSCMDEFCLLDESEGYRCACSDNINKSRDMILEIQEIQDEADKLYTEGVEREKLGAQAKLVFGQSDAAKKSSHASGKSFAEWLAQGRKNKDFGYSSIYDDDDDSLGADSDIGGNLFAIASNYCGYTLKSCKSKAEMEEVLYSRQIVADCKYFESYLNEQKRNAEANKRTAEAAVRAARQDKLGTTNRYNRGECLLAYRACIADKGGCGVHFENCLDKGLLGRRANACENILDQCMAVRSEVLVDWEKESKTILAEAEKYAESRVGEVCKAKTTDCLEQACSVSTDSMCLSSIDLAVGMCPIISECDSKIKGFKGRIGDILAETRSRFCENDVDKCLRDKCGQDFSAPECIAKKPTEIVALCPQSKFASCKGESKDQFSLIVTAARMQMDHRLLQGCINYFSEQLGRVCGVDMACLENIKMPSLDGLPYENQDPIRYADVRSELKQKAMANARDAVKDFFKQFEKDQTVSACQSAQQPAGGRVGLGTSVFNTAKLIAEVNAENRAVRMLEQEIAEYNRTVMHLNGRENCLSTYRAETYSRDEDKPMTYIKSVSYEPDLNNCHVCRVERVCAVGGEDKGTSAAKWAAGTSTALASAGTLVTPVWGTAIGAAAGTLLGAGIGYLVGDEEDPFCQEIESCEDVNVDDVVTK